MSSSANTHKTNLDDALDRALNLLRGGKQDETLIACQEIVRHHPTEPGALHICALFARQYHTTERPYRLAFQILSLVERRTVIAHRTHNFFRNR